VADAPARPADDPASRHVTRERRLLFAILLGYLVLGAAASVLVPLWEIPDENEHLAVVAHWAETGAMPDLNVMPRYALNEGVHPPLAYWAYALGHRALGLGDEEYLPRRRYEALGSGDAAFLHGADELWPFAAPIAGLHWLRLIGLLFGLVTITASWALGRRLLPDRSGPGLLAAALVAFNPAFLVLSVGISNDTLAIALSAASLVALADISRGGAIGARPIGAGRCLLVGALIGLAHMAKLSATFLLPVVPVALLLGRPRGEPFARVVLRAVWMGLAFLVVTGAYFAWNVSHYGDPFAWGYLLEKYPVERQVALVSAIWNRYVPVMARSYVAYYGEHVTAGRAVLVVWSIVAAGAAGGWLLLARRRLSVVRPVVVLLMCALAVNVASSLKFFIDFNQPQGRYMYPSLAALAALFALGWRGLAGRRAVLLLALGLALAAVAAHSQRSVLAKAYWPPNAEDDPYAMSFNPLAGLGEEQFRADLSIESPADGAALDGPPTLEWEETADPGARYTVHLSTPGMPYDIRTWEHFGQTLTGSYAVPPATWSRLPPGLPMECRVLRLPTLAEAMAVPRDRLVVPVSRPIRVQRAGP